MCVQEQEKALVQKLEKNANYRAEFRSDIQVNIHALYLLSSTLTSVILVSLALGSRGRVHAPVF